MGDAADGMTWKVRTSENGQCEVGVGQLALLSKPQLMNNWNHLGKL